MIGHFHTKAEAEQYVLEELEKKYGMEFVVDTEHDEPGYTEYPLKIAYTGFFHPKDDPEKATYVWVTNVDTMRDTYAQYYFKDEAEDQLTSFVEEVDGLEKVEVTFEAHKTAETITNSITLAEYIRLTNSSYRVEITLPDGLTDEEYIAKIKELAQKINVKTRNYNYKIIVNDQTFFFKTMTSKIPALTDERIAEDIESQRFIQEILESDDSSE